MNSENKVLITGILEQMSIYFKRPLDRDTLKTYLNGLERYHPKVVDKAAARMMDELEFFPKLKDFHTFIRSFPKPETPALPEPPRPQTEPALRYRALCKMLMKRSNPIIAGMGCWQPQSKAEQTITIELAENYIPIKRNSDGLTPDREFTQARLDYLVANGMTLEEINRIENVRKN